MKGRHKEKSPGHPSEIVLLSQVDIGPLFRPQGAGADILTKYILSLHWKRLGRGTLQMK